MEKTQHKVFAVNLEGVVTEVHWLLKQKESKELDYPYPVIHRIL